MESAVQPLLSVVIPTANRPEFLPRAIASALCAGLDGSVEVIVVPNGTDDTWHDCLNQFSGDVRVSAHPTVTQHANVARNHGLALARGRYVRFLDDDDYLFGGLSSAQLAFALDHDADICSGGVTLVDERERPIGEWLQPSTDDLVIAALCPERVTQPTAHLFRRTAIAGQRWDESLAVRQDTDWMLRLCLLPGIKWARFDGPVGTWVQHTSSRVSRGKDPGREALRHTASLIIDAIEVLRNRGELTPARRAAAADGLWSSLQKGVQYELRFWFAVARKARSLDANSKPPSRVYRMPGLRHVDPLIIALLLVPPRLVLRFARAALDRIKRSGRRP